MWVCGGKDIPCGPNYTPQTHTWLTKNQAYVDYMDGDDDSRQAQKL